MREKISGIAIGIVQEMIDAGELLASTAITPDTQLYGESGELDSMGLVSLVLALEQSIESNFGISVSLADERALSQTRSPYRTIDSLAEYAASQIEELS